MKIKTPLEVLDQRAVNRRARKVSLFNLVNAAIDKLETVTWSAERVEVPIEMREFSEDVVARYEREGWRCYIEQSTSDIIIRFRDSE